MPTRAQRTAPVSALFPAARPLRVLARVTSGLALGWLTACSAPSGPDPGSSSSAATLTVSASAKAPPPEPTPAPPGEPKGDGFKTVRNAKDSRAECKLEQFEVATYLQRGELTLAGRPDNGGQFAASWLVQLPYAAQIAFAGYDRRARRISRDRGIANSREHPPRLFATGGQWTVAWFDDKGLAYAHPSFESTEKPAIEHLTAARSIPPEMVALASMPDGSLIVASPIGTEGNQLSIFLFAPAASGQQRRGLGITKHAKKPSSPAVTADESGYTVAWLEQDGRIMSTRFDLEGDEIDAGANVVGPAPGRTALSLTRLKSGALLTWLEGPRILSRKLDLAAKPSGDIIVVGTGKHPTVIEAGDEAIVAFVTEVDKAPDQLVAVRVGAAGVSEQAMRISDGRTPVLDAPAIALGGERVAAMWNEVMGPTIKSRRAWLRVFDASCL